MKNIFCVPDKLRRNKQYMLAVLLFMAMQNMFSQAVLFSTSFDLMQPESVHDIPGAKMRGGEAISAKLYRKATEATLESANQLTATNLKEIANLVTWEKPRYRHEISSLEFTLLKRQCNKKFKFKKSKKRKCQLDVAFLEYQYGLLERLMEVKLDNKVPLDLRKLAWLLRDDIIANTRVRMHKIKEKTKTGLMQKFKKNLDL